jgi:hypothetical protein
MSAIGGIIGWTIAAGASALIWYLTAPDLAPLFNTPLARLTLRDLGGFAWGIFWFWFCGGIVLTCLSEAGRHFEQLIDPPRPPPPPPLTWDTARTYDEKMAVIMENLSAELESDE